MLWDGARWISLGWGWTTSMGVGDLPLRMGEEGDEQLDSGGRCDGCEPGTGHGAHLVECAVV